MKINTNRADIAFSVGNAAQFPRDPRPQIAFSGKSNVGKSTLINTLLGRKSLARVSATPGKTVTVNFYDVDKKLYFVDLPGYGYAQRSKESQKVWSRVTEDYFVKNPSPDAVRLVLALFDIRNGPSDDDILMINFLIDHDIPFVVIGTKADKLSKTALAAKIDELEKTVFAGTGIRPLPYSGVSGLGKDEIWKKIEEAARL